MCLLEQIVVASYKLVITHLDINLKITQITTTLIVLYQETKDPKAEAEPVFVSFIIKVTDLGVMGEEQSPGWKEGW